MNDQQQAEREAVWALEVQRGVETKALLENPLFKQLFEEIERDIVTRAERIPPDQADKRDSLWRELGAVAQVKAKAQRFILTGRIAELQQRGLFAKIFNRK